MHLMVKLVAILETERAQLAISDTFDSLVYHWITCMHMQLYRSIYREGERQIYIQCKDIWRMYISADSAQLYICTYTCQWMN